MFIQTQTARNSTQPSCLAPLPAGPAAPPPPAASDLPDAGGWAERVLAVACAATVLALATPALHAQTNPPPARGATSATSACPALLNHRVPRLQDEQPQHLCQYAGQVLLVVNTASYCGFTGQYEGLEALNARFARRGLVVMGFPSNDFKQEDSDAKKIADLCFNTYGVKFPMFTTVSVRGPAAHPLFAQLAQATGQAPGWNFNKYLVGRDGKVIAHFDSRVAPEHPSLVAAVERALAAAR
jgi:glutathione peroxidase